MPQKFTTVRDALEYAEHAFSEAGLYFGHGTDNAWDEAVALVIAVLDLPPDVDNSVLTQALTEAQSARCDELFQLRLEKRIPSAYLTQQTWFCGLPFHVDERVIIPRSPIAELIQDQFSPWVEATHIKRVLDLCCGSACIAIACAYAFPDAKVDAVDISNDALAVAKINVAEHHLAERVALMQSDVFSAIDKQYDIIVTNPPYVDAADIASMPAEYHHEPSLALASGADGLELTRQILCDAAQHLTDDGILVCEVGNSADALEVSFPGVAFTWLSFEHGGDGVFLLTKKQLLALNEAS